MAMLHVVNKSPFEKDSLASCLRHVKEGSSILLIEDGVLGAMKGTVVTDSVATAMSQINFHVLGADLEARGVSTDKLVDGIQVVDYAGFVDLVAGHDNLQSWL